MLLCCPVEFWWRKFLTPVFSIAVFFGKQSFERSIAFGVIGRWSDQNDR